MPAPVGPLVGFVLGIGFAWVSGAALTRRSEVIGRAMLLVTAYAVLVFAPAAAYFVVYAPDWSFAYWIDTDRLPAVVDPALVLLDAVSVPLGFGIGARQLGVRRTSALGRLAAVPAAVTIVFLVVASPRLAIDATYARFQGDFGVQSIAGSPLGYALLWMTIVTAAGALLTARALRRVGETPPSTR